MPKQYKNIIITSISDLDNKMTNISSEGFDFDGIFEFNSKSSIAVFSRELPKSPNQDTSVRDGLISKLRFFAQKDPSRFIHCVKEIREGRDPECSYGGLSEFRSDPLERSKFSVEAIEAVMRYVVGDGVDMKIVDK